jgi:hypothetical protein
VHSLNTEIISNLKKDTEFTKKFNATYENIINKNIGNRIDFLA